MATTIKIIEQFNESIKHIQRAFDSSKQGDIANAQKELEKSSTCIYQVIEWAVKNVLLSIYNNPSLHNTEIAIIEGFSFPPKITLFEKSVTPSLSSIGISSKVILDLKKTVRNLPEHSGFIPHYSSLIKVVQEAEKLILNYIDSNAILNKIPVADSTEIPTDESWSEFYNACDSFNKYKNYILLIGPNGEFAQEKLTYLGLLDWSLIIDFNANTEINGLYKNACSEIEARKKVHLLTSDDNLTFSPYNSCYWFAANGLKGRSGTLTTDFKSWNRKYLAFLNKLFLSYFQTFGDNPTNVVILWDDSLYVQRICDAIDFASGEKTKFIYAIQDLTKLTTVSAIYTGKEIEISIPKISDGILRIRNFYNSDLVKEMYTLPAKEEEYISIDKRDFLWIEEDIEIVHRNILESSDIQSEDLPEREKFYKGNQITWLGLHMHHDIDREKTSSLKKKVEKELKDRNIIKISLHHYPGVGGTTLSRRLAWDLKNEFPVLLLRKFRQLDTVQKIYKIFDLTKKSVFVIAEASIVNIDEIDKLFNEILSRGFPCVLLVVQRSESNGLNSFNLEDLLTDLEFKTFIAKYKELCPNKGVALDRLSKSTEKKERHPFYLGLTAFEENFTGLPNFVETNLKGATEVQKKVMSIIALCYFFGQKETSSQMLSTLLMTPENSVVMLDQHLNDNLLSLLINENSILWRPIHYLVAQELLCQLLSIDKDNKTQWKNYLPDLAITVITLISDKSSIPSENDTELLKRLFVYRDNQETLGKEEDLLFSNFIEKGLQSDEARLRIFKQLTISFPEESHFWAHLARFYSLRMKNHNEALAAITTAIDFSNGKDSLLYHMKGMCLRAIVRDKINKLLGNKNAPQSEVLEIYNIIDECGEAFEECRIINPSNEHGYISHIQILVNVIDFSYSISRFKNKTDFLRNLNSWLQEKLDLAEELLDSMKLQTQLRMNNAYVEQCDLSLQELYENYSLVIEGWNNLLTKTITDKPIIRRSIIRAYVRRAKSWDTVDTKDIEKILKLIEENIQEEPQKGNNIYLWFQAARQSDRIDINTAIDKVSNWRATSDMDESLYYLGVLHTIQAIEGTSISKIKAEKIIRELSERKRNAPYRTHCYEWFGNGYFLKRLVPYKNAISRDDTNELIFNTELLEKVTGKISFIKGPEAGNIELTCGLSAFFIPARGYGFSRDKDLNRNVIFYLGFSYDGLRAFDVEAVD